MRPTKIEEVLGQEHLTKDDGPIGIMLKTGALSSFILWGPAGCGKTTIAKLLAERADFHFVMMSAVFSGVADLKKVFAEAKERRERGTRTLLFVDEIHRFNKAQQDGFLPYVENGTVILVGATTENPSFELNSALLSRCRVFVLKRLDDKALARIIDRAENIKDKKLQVDDSAKEYLAAMADGDGRALINMLEFLFDLPEDFSKDGLLSAEALSKVLRRRAPVFDKSGDGHYNFISALHKSLRGSDADAALYYMARMLDAGEEPLYILRRLLRFSIEDVGLADPQALVYASHAIDAYERLGSPEGEIAIAALVVYLAVAPKSNSVYKALGEVMKTAQATGSLMPPMCILNAPTNLMKDIGYSEGYKYDHDEEDGFSGQNYFPEKMGRRTFYRPVERGFEREIIKRLNWFEKMRNLKNEKS